MKVRLFIIGILLLACEQIQAQDSIKLIKLDNPIIAGPMGKGYAAEADTSREYFYYPSYLFADSITTILTGAYRLRQSSPKINQIILFYHATHRDGYFNIVLTPSQIYNTITHVNPNPNSKKWAQDIDSQQFVSVLKAIQKDTIAGFKRFQYEGSSTLRLWDSLFKSDIKYPYDIDQEKFDSLFPLYLKEEERQTQMYLSLLNEMLPPGVPPIQIAPKETRDKIKSKYLSVGLKSYYDSCPQWITLPEEN